METSQPLSIESFSYSWLVNLKPSLESLDNSLRASLDASDEASFIEMDPRMPPSKRFFRNSQDFKFDFPISQSPLTLVHADELFSNGYVMPLFVDPLKMEAYDVSDSTSVLHTSSHAPKTVVSACKPQRCSSLRRCRRLSKQIVQKYLDFLRPLYRRIRGHRSSSRAENIDSKVQVMKNWVYSAETSPRISVAYSVDDCWRRSCDSESSIYEAVLHCKRSNGKTIMLLMVPTDQVKNKANINAGESSREGNIASILGNLPFRSAFRLIVLTQSLLWTLFVAISLQQYCSIHFSLLYNCAVTEFSLTKSTD
ncbi:membrane-associated kinase regulator 6 [Populus alba x Populus x berolinensis]|nr:membrane-associated kinase regulator 6 [Populus alba x Populus x berolinensis]